MPTQTSIQAYHGLKSEGSQKLRIAIFCEKETKGGRPVWITKIADSFMLKGERDLAQLSTVSARFNSIKKDGVIIEGRNYKLEFVKEARPVNGRNHVEMFFLVLDKPAVAVQGDLFQL